MKIRKYFCWLLGHKYQGIWFKKNKWGDQAGIADTETGCVYCGHTKPNWFPIDANKIDWEATKHRSELPKSNVYGGIK